MSGNGEAGNDYIDGLCILFRIKGTRRDNAGNGETENNFVGRCILPEIKCRQNEEYV